jgi:hypothetical protein
VGADRSARRGRDCPADGAIELSRLAG